MKFLSIAILAALAFGCPSRESTTSTDTVSTSGTVVTGISSKTSTGATGGVVSTLSEDDKKFFISAAQRNSAIIALSRVALDQAASANVKNFANHLLADHDSLDHELKDLALRKGVALPADSAAVMPNVDVDHAYVQQMVSDHQKAIDDFSSASLKDPDLRAWAAKTLPMLRDHLAAAKKLSGS